MNDLASPTPRLEVRNGASEDIEYLASNSCGLVGSEPGDDRSVVVRIEWVEAHGKCLLLVGTTKGVSQHSRRAMRCNRVHPDSVVEQFVCSADGKRCDS